MKRQIYLLLVFILVGNATIYAQDPIFTQFYAAPLQINPAFAGITYAPRITLNYRSQWADIEGGYETYAAAYEQSIEGINSGIGLMLMTDNIGNGLYQTNYFSAVYGYQVKVSDKLSAKFGVEAGLIQSRVDWDRLIFPDQLDPVTGAVDAGGNPNESGEMRPDNLSQTDLDISAGVLLYTPQFYIGLSAKHLNRPTENLLEINNNLIAGRPMRITGHAGFEINLGGRNIAGGPAFITPNVMVISQGPFGQVNAGAYGGFGRFYGGFWYRHAWSNPDAAIALIGFREGIFRIGYSYDLTLSELASAPGGLGGTHEISVTINFEDSKQLERERFRNRYSDCFKIFN